MVSDTPTMVSGGSHNSAAREPVPPPAPAPPPPPAIDPVGLPNNALLPLNLRLDRSNYSYWRVLVLAAIRAYNLDGFVLGHTPPPPPVLPGNVPNIAFYNWTRLDQFIMHWLMNSMTESILGLVLNCNTSSEIWSTVAQIFATKSKARILQVQGLLQSTKKCTLSVDEYVLKMKNYADALNQAGEPLSDERLCLYILGGLGPEYEATVINLINRSDSLTLTDLCFSLHNQEMRIQNSSPPSLDNVQANFANMSFRGNYNNNNNRGGGRGNRGNSNRGGRNNNSNSGRGRGNSKLVCQLCGRTGHTVHKCFHRFDVHFSGTYNPPSPTPSPNADSSQANLSEMNQSDDNSDAWFLDSGATNHMTNNSQMLSTK